jgi:hypothetical protein
MEGFWRRGLGLRDEEYTVTHGLPPPLKPFQPSSKIPKGLTYWNKSLNLKILNLVMSSIGVGGYGKGVGKVGEGKAGNLADFGEWLRYYWDFIRGIKF